MTIKYDELSTILKGFERHFTQGRWNDDDARPRIHVQLNDNVYTLDNLPAIAEGDTPVIQVRWEIPDVALDQQREMDMETASILKAIEKFPDAGVAVWDEESTKILRQDIARALHDLREKFHTVHRQAIIKVFATLTGLDHPSVRKVASDDVKLLTLDAMSEPIVHDIMSNAEQRLGIEGFYVEGDRIVIRAEFLERYKDVFLEMVENAAYYLDVFDLPPFDTGMYSQEDGTAVALLEDIALMVARYDMMVAEEIQDVIEKHGLGRLGPPALFALEQGLRGYAFDNDWMPSPSPLEMQLDTFDNQAITLMLDYAERQIEGELTRMVGDMMRPQKGTTDIVH